MAAGESTPLLGSSSPPQAQEESSPLLAPSAPPPADAPPPFPEEETAPLQSSDKDGKSSSWWHKKQNSVTSIDTSTIDDTSQSQLSLSQSKKKRSNRKKRGDAASNNSTSKRSLKSTNSSKSKKKKKGDDGPKKTPFHLLFDMVRYLAIFASVAMFLMQFYPIVVLTKEDMDITGLQYFVRIYLMIFCVSFILLESRIPLLRRLTFTTHDNWVLRGFMYTFIGIIGMEQDLAVKVEDIASGAANVLGPDYGTLFASLSIAITTWIMIAVGVLYMILGVMCLQKWYDRLEKDYYEKVADWKRKKKREKEFQKEKEEYMKYEKDRREGRGEWYDDIETGK